MKLKTALLSPPTPLVLSIALAAVLFVQLLFNSSAHAQSANTPAAAIAQAMEKNGQPGKVIGVREKGGENGAGYFEVKILTNGKVRVFKIPKR